ncbi:MAG: hypothetical protein EA394_10515 [Bacteroidia bacterium]|nr:MAG: hypothetical protein EA394_10515 [Bacteroidia bacterium]
MAINLTSFARQLTIMAGILFFLYYVFHLVMPQNYTPFLYWAVIPYFYIVVMGSKYVLNVLTGGRKRGKFDVHFVNITMIRFLLYVSVVLIYAFLRPEDAIVFIITFFVFYFFFTLFEVVFLYRDLKKE